MVGSGGPRMLRLTLPSVPIWNGWLCDANSYPEAYPALVEPVDEACREVGRDPSTVERTVSISVDPSGRRDFPRHWYLEGNLEGARPLTGSPEEIAATLRGFRDLGIQHFVCGLDPCTPASIEWFAQVIALLDADG